MPLKAEVVDLAAREFESEYGYSTVWWPTSARPDGKYDPNSTLYDTSESIAAIKEAGVEQAEGLLPAPEVG